MRQSEIDARARAAAAIPESERDRCSGAIDLYARAVDLVDRLEVEWEKIGFPLLTLGGATGAADVPHPVVKMLAEARRDVLRFGQALGLDPVSATRTTKRAPGGQTGQQTAADRAAPPPVTKLRATG
jgi:hypothetical protein